MRLVLVKPETPEEEDALDELCTRIAERLAPIMAQVLDVRPLLKNEGVAYRLGCSLTKAKELITSGKIGSVMIGEQRRVEQRELDRYIESCRSGVVMMPADEKPPPDPAPVPPRDPRDPRARLARGRVQGVLVDGEGTEA